MKIKLTQSGGFIGRSKSTFLETQKLSPELFEMLEQFFVEDEPKNKPGQARDQEKYYWILENEESPITKKINPQTLSPELKALFEQMKDNLQFE